MVHTQCSVGCQQGYFGAEVKEKLTQAKCRCPKLPSLSLPGSFEIHEHPGSRGRNGSTDPALRMLTCMAWICEGKEMQE